MKALDRRVAETQTPEQLQNIAKEGQKLGLDIKFTELKPTEKLSEIANLDDKEPSRAKQKKPRL